MMSGLFFARPFGGNLTGKLTQTDDGMHSTNVKKSHSTVYIIIKKPVSFVQSLHEVYSVLPICMSLISC